MLCVLTRDNCPYKCSCKYIWYWPLVVIPPEPPSVLPSPLSATTHHIIKHDAVNNAIMAVSTFARTHQTYHALKLKFENCFRNRWGQNTRVTGLPGREKSLTISSPVYAIHECVRQMDRRIPLESKDRAYTYRSAVRKVIIWDGRMQEALVVLGLTILASLIEKQPNAISVLTVVTSDNVIIPDNVTTTDNVIIIWPIV